MNMRGSAGQPMDHANLLGGGAPRLVAAARLGDLEQVEPVRRGRCVLPRRRRRAEPPPEQGLLSGDLEGNRGAG